MESFMKLRSYIMSQHRMTQDNIYQGFVTISRQAGAGGGTVGEKLAVYLNAKLPGRCPWTVFDKALVDTIVKENELPDRILPYLKEAKTPMILDMVEDLMELCPSQATLVKRANKTILRLAKSGRAILVGRGAPVLTKEINGGVHVRLIGSFKKRKEHIMEYFKMSAKEAVKFIESEDRGRAQYLKAYFNRNIDDPFLYDVVINTDSVVYGDAVPLIGDMVIRKIRCEEVQMGMRK